MIRRALCLLFLIPSLQGFAEGGFVYVASAGAGELIAFDVESGDPSRIPLSGSDVAGVFPTPGGKFVFVTFRDSDLISVVDAETMMEARTFTLAEGRPDSMVFTPMGHAVYVGLASGAGTIVYDHSRSELTYRGPVEGGVPGSPLVFNRRGTRFYRSTDQGLGYFLETTQEEIKRVRHGAGSAAWAPTADFRFLWGVGSQSGIAVVVDERRGRVAATLEGQYAGLQPVLTRSHAFLVDADRRTIVKLGIGSQKVEDTVELSNQIRSIVLDGAGSLWVATDGGLLTVDPSTLAVRPIQRLDAPPGIIAYGTFKPGEGFACF